MQVQNDSHPWNVRALLESTATPFTLVDYRPRGAIFRQGDPCDNVMHIERGRAWLAVTTPSGKEAICGLLDSGAFLGEEALTGCATRRQSATAMTATQVLVVAKAHMVRLLRTQPGLQDRFIAYLLARNIRLEASLTEQFLYAGEQRLAHLLIVLMVGTTRPRVKAFMSTFKKLGFVEEKSGVLHVNPARLSGFHDGDRRISTAASTAIPKAPEPEERPWTLGGR